MQFKANKLFDIFIEYFIDFKLFHFRFIEKIHIHKLYQKKIESLENKRVLASWNRKSKNDV